RVGIGQVLTSSINTLGVNADLVSYTILNQNVMFDSLRWAVIIALIVATVGRALTSLLFLSLKEQKNFPSSWGEVAKHIRKRFDRGPQV
ncbi:MAG: hypothetical protein ACTSQF_05065, partial [Candidatus Heimdallarchaeaceae archaeon]